MTFARVLLGWALVTGLFAGWRELERRMRETPIGALPALRASLPAVMTESALLTLFAGLWFGSLGSGGALLLFLLLGALMEIPARWRAHSDGGVPWKPVIGGIVRIVIAGMLLGWIMG